MTARLVAASVDAPPGRGPVSRAAVNFAPLAVGHLGSSVLLLANTILLARILGVAAFGLLAIGVAVYGLTAFLGDAGLGIWGLRVIRDGDDPWATVLLITSTRAVATTLALASAVLLLLLLPLPPGATAPALVIVSAMVPLGLSVDWVLLGLELTGRAAVVRLMTAGATVLFCPLLATSAGALGAAAGYVVATSIGAATGWILVRRTLGPVRWVAPSGIVRVLRRSVPLGASAILAQVFWITDGLLAGVLLGPAAAGLYGASSRLLTAVVGLGTLLGTALLPVFRAVDRDSPVVATRFAMRVTGLLLLGVLPAVGIVAGGAPIVIDILFGPGYAASAPVLAIGATTVATWTCAIPGAYLLLARGQDARFLAMVLTAVLVAIPGIVVLAPVAGIVGIAGAQLAGAAAGAVVVWAALFSRSDRAAVFFLARAGLAGLGLGVAGGIVAGRGGLAALLAAAILTELPFARAVAREVRSPQGWMVRP